MIQLTAVFAVGDLNAVLSLAMRARIARDDTDRSIRA